MAENDQPDLRLPAGARVAVVAGGGRLPQEVVTGLVRAGQKPLVMLIEGEAEWPENPDYDLWTVPAEHLGLCLPRLRRAGVTHLVMAGAVTRRPPLLKIRFGLDIFRLLPRLAAAYARGDDGLLRALIAHVESYGIKVVGAHEIVPDLLAQEGAMTRARPAKADRSNIAAAMQAARTIGALDIGQAAVAIGGRAVALEGIEGTAGLLERMKELRSHGRLAGKTGGVLAKCMKPGQERRADLPAIGPETVESAHAAGLSGIAVEAGHSLILDYAETISRANDHGLFVFGVAEQGDGE